MLLLLSLERSFAATLVVSTAGPYTTISSAVTAAASGDTLEIDTGTWAECVDTAGKSLTLVGAGSAATVIAPGGRCSNAVTVDAGESVELRDLGVTNTGYRGIYVSGSTLTLDTLAVSSSGATSFNGGGVYVDSGGVVEVTGSTFTSNTAYAGGAIYAEAASTVAVTDTTFTSNGAYYAGAIYVAATSGAASLTLDGVTFTSNAGYYNGGAVYLDSGTSLSSADTVWSSNRGYYTHGNALYVGAGAAWTGSHDQLDDNYSYYYTAGYSGAVYVAASATVDLDSPSFTDNYGYHGAAIYATAAASLVLTDGEFTGNIAYYYGGALYLSGVTDVVLDGTLFGSNTGTYGYGGAAFVSSGGLEVTVVYSPTTSPTTVVAACTRPR